MANEVKTQIHFKNLNEKSKEILYSFYDKINKNNDKENFLDFFKKNKNENHDSYEILGVKWAYIESKGEDYIDIISANYMPEKGIELLIKELSKNQNDLCTIIKFEEEYLYNRGIIIYDGDEVLASDIVTKEELIDWIIAKTPELRGSYDFDSETWKNKKFEEIFDEIIYDALEEFDNDFINDNININQLKFQDL